MCVPKAEKELHRSVDEVIGFLCVCLGWQPAGAQRPEASVCGTDFFAHYREEELRRCDEHVPR